MATLTELYDCYKKYLEDNKGTDIQFPGYELKLK